MATIGSFKKSENGDYAGAVKTLTLNVKARITPAEKTNDKATDFRIFAGRGEVEFGAAWRKTSNEGREYLSVKLDDPSFPSPIYASLVEVEGEDGLSPNFNTTPFEIRSATGQHRRHGGVSGGGKGRGQGL